MDKVTCVKCGQKVSNADQLEYMMAELGEVFIPNGERWICGVCNCRVDPCQICGSHDVVLEDFGITRCELHRNTMTAEQRGQLQHDRFMDNLESGRI